MARVLISLPDDFLADVDAFAERERRSRSELIREALRAYMASAGGPPRAAGQADARKSLDDIQRMRRDAVTADGPTSEAWLKALRERRG